MQFAMGDRRKGMLSINFDVQLFLQSQFHFVVY